MRSSFRTTLAVLSAAAILVTGCARKLEGDSYVSDATVGKVVYGTVISSRAVKVRDSDKLSKGNGAGLLGGGAVGYGLGHTIGKGSGRRLSSIGGAVAGAVLVSMIQNSLSTQDGFEYIVRLDTITSNPMTPVPAQQISVVPGASISMDVKNAMQLASAPTDVISVIQTGGTLLPPGQRVMVVYNDDRPRVSPL